MTNLHNTTARQPQALFSSRLHRGLALCAAATVTLALLAGLNGMAHSEQGALAWARAVQQAAQPNA